ncbi:hypothetical protein MJG53_003662 [Ovis ammon polii x Ovis aries]|uniref:Uncharacterized protein n=1 Tax=Ovis ammon polii x Ovis aries TaxID=2918886 RepID=A0ACB9VI94_9CETA|nr:hypothetical protein MJG53_003662 [Ovis ammon polii x Ovis aries]
MGRTHAPGKGLSQSALPYHHSIPTWLKLTSDDVKEQIYKLAKKGLTLSQIGVILRDSHGVAQVRFVTGNKILRILKSKGLAPDLPEDLYHLIKKAVAVRKHLERNRKDKDVKFRLILIESRIHRFARYYKTKRVLPTPPIGNTSGVEKIDSPRKHNKKAMILGNHQISDITKKWKIFLKIVKIYKKWDILEQTI